MLQRNLSPFNKTSSYDQAPRVAIAMATYNGSHYIEDQIKSIQDQSFKDWFLLIRDDGSTDGTIDIVLRLAKTDQRIILVQDELGNLGVTQNFARLMQVAVDGNADYVAMSDQDDFWRRDKLEILLEEIRELETANNVHLPILIHSDLEVVNEEMCTIAPSFMSYAKISPEPLQLGHLLCQNDVTGCTCLVNRALLELVLPIPQSVPIHDWWMALLALTSGKIGYVDQTLVRYRQHTGNIVGARSSLARLINNLLAPAKWHETIGAVHSSIHQANLLTGRLKVIATPWCQSGAIEKFSLITNAPRLQRLRILAVNKIYKRSWFANSIFKLIICSLSTSPRRKP